MATLMSAPESNESQTIEPLGTLEAYDAVLNDDYAFVMYKETDRDSGAWRVRIKGRHLTGVVFEPAMIATNARATSAQGKPFFTWGNGIDPSAGDARSLQYRVHCADGKPTHLEIAIRLRRADGTADQEKSLRVAWPG